MKSQFYKLIVVLIIFVLPDSGASQKKVQYTESELHQNSNLSIDGIVNEFLDLLSVDSGQPVDTAKIRTLFIPSARLIVLNNSSGDSSFVETADLNEFLLLLTSTYYQQGYLEKETKKVYDEFNGIAQVFQSFNAQDSEGLEVEGINSYQLVFFDKRWWIASLMWTVLSDTSKFSEKYGRKQNYMDYHKGIIATEQLIVEHKFEIALKDLDSIFNSYDFVFLRDYKIASQLAAAIGDKEKALKYLRLGIESGWSINQIKKNELVSPLLDSISKSEIDLLSNCHKQRISLPLRQKIFKLYKNDQKMAFKALFRIGQKAKIRYAEEKFASHSEKQLIELIDIFEIHDYPGEQMIGNNYWVSTILSHHNSISSEYNKNDTLYEYIKPKLELALKQGNISPYEIALIEDWKTASESNHTKVLYGYLGPILDTNTVKTVNVLRNQIGLRSIELRNSLIDIQTEARIDFYLPGHPWQSGKITVANK